jgi:hypothetical protein
MGVDEPDQLRDPLVDRQLLPAVDDVRLRLFAEVLRLSAALQAAREHPGQRPRPGHAVDPQLGVQIPVVPLPDGDRLSQGLIGDAGLRDPDLRLDLLDDLGCVAVRLRPVEGDRLLHLRPGERSIGSLALQQRRDGTVADGALEP